MKRLLPLSPVLSKSEKIFLDDQKLALDLLNAFGSPLNIVFPQEAQNNFQRFKNLFSDFELTGNILYAQKASRSIALLRELIFAGSGTDNASLFELQRALANGCSTELAEAGGPKNEDYIGLACFSGSLINIDSVYELHEVKRIAEKFSLKPRILLRLSGFKNKGIQILSKPTRFGIDVDSIDEVLTYVKQHEKRFTFEGLSYHLDTVAISEKAIALNSLVQITLKAMSMGLSVKMLDIGGGFKVNYLQDQTAWETYMTTLRESLLGKQEPLTWQSNGFGLRAENGVIRGSLNMYSYYDDLVQENYLKELLNQNSTEAGMTFAQFFKETRIELVLEPGRALLAGAGITLARVEEVSHSSTGETFVRLDMNRADVTFQDLELFVDPIIISRIQSEKKETPKDGCYLIGNLCLESDFISRRKVYLPHFPKVGDALAFANSAGYLMDFNSHQAALQRIAEKIAVFTDEKNTLRWVRDEEYWPAKYN